MIELAKTEKPQRAASSETGLRVSFPFPVHRKKDEIFVGYQARSDKPNLEMRKNG
jgi:hypothetical protein